jgi:hypothetical protein
VPFLQLPFGGIWSFVLVLELFFVDGGVTINHMVITYFFFTAITEGKWEKKK